MCNEKQREIRFRGKRVDNGEWAEGYYIEAHYHWHNHGVHKEWIVSAACANGGWFSIHGRYPVVADTVGQYTGLTDKNGTKIFEGDIIECSSEGVSAQGTVQQRKDGMWIIYPSWQKHIMWGLCPDENMHTTVEVIGNIHDTPELLEEAQHAE